MNSPAHFRFLLDSVQSQARSTPSVLHEENEHFWEDIVDSFESRHEKPNYWIFCTRWLREDLLRVIIDELAVDEHVAPSAGILISFAKHFHVLSSKAWTVLATR